MAIFRYPDAPHVRRHGPRGYANYESYKPWLRDEFAFCCVYCRCRERWFPDGEAAFGADHLDPQSTSPDLRNVYENLVCACCQCNSIRGIAPIPSPFEEAYGRHLRVLENGLVEALTPEGTELIGICRLNRPALATFRRGIAEVLDLLSRRHGPQAETLLQNYLGYPASLPNLERLRPPGGNTKPNGIKESHFARKNRGELPDLY